MPAQRSHPALMAAVVWGFFGAPFNDNNPNDSVLTPDARAAWAATFTGKWDAPEGNGTTLAAQLANLRAGRAYINFHTVQFGGGEIRGNFPAEDAFRNSLVAGLTRRNLDAGTSPESDRGNRRAANPRTQSGLCGDGILWLSAPRS
mgnify:CR=1 FL=1